jgi:pimeloyl-ACP methyl ester carboxylesterase
MIAAASLAQRPSAGPASGTPVILLHGWPYDIHSFVDATALLTAKGYRVIVPYLRGYGTTAFLSGDTVRNAQQSVVALDIIALMDALKIDKAVIGGFDWGARTADIMAAIWPERCKALVSVSGYHKVPMSNAAWVTFPVIIVVGPWVSLLNTLPKVFCRPMGPWQKPPASRLCKPASAGGWRWIILIPGRQGRLRSTGYFRPAARGSGWAIFQSSSRLS